MQYCDVEVQGFIAEECGEPASVKVEGRWHCEYHADALERALARWSGPEWVAQQSGIKGITNVEGSPRVTQMPRSKLKKCRAVGPGPRGRCGKRAVGEVRSRGQWHPICREHALYFFSLLRFFREAR